MIERIEGQLHALSEIRKLVNEHFNGAYRVEIHNMLERTMDIDADLYVVLDDVSQQYTLLDKETYVDLIERQGW